MEDSGEEKLSRRLLMAGALAGLLIALIASAQTDRSALSQAGAIASVNDAHIDRTEYATALQALLADKTKAPTAKDRALVLNRLIEEELLVQRGIEIGLLEGDASVRKAVARAVIDFAMTRNAQKEINEEELRGFMQRILPASLRQHDYKSNGCSSAAAMMPLPILRASIKCVTRCAKGKILMRRRRNWVTPYCRRCRAHFCHAKKCMTIWAHA